MLAAYNCTAGHAHNGSLQTSNDTIQPNRTSDDRGIQLFTFDNGVSRYQVS